MHIKNADALQGFGSPHGEIVFELIGNAAGGSQAHSMAKIVIPPGKASRKHYHPVAEESYFILTGTARMEMNGEVITLSSGDSVMIPPPQVHQISNAGEKDLVLLAICVPAWTPDNSVYLD
jgi:mannose-6-phosphate isomerase-like protein (cupin superfamily)